ncbi:MAG: sigma-70 family RNA polymerase sigma factor [Planctomycetes bacterium]|nr:sigma-70 family RNA polymerase sigma factor [Planctomycetota bacterium]MBI3834420.1 sigma-70 family RNA polymerase sigma factor [Planctomycetota bacterium]
MDPRDQTSIVQLLDAAQSDPISAPELLGQVYSQLRALAQTYLRSERPNHTLQATAVVHEAYMRLVGSGNMSWETPAHFFAAVAETMRRVLIDYARARGRLKRGGKMQRMDIPDMPLFAPDDPEELMRLDSAIERLAAAEPEMAQVVRLRFFVGLDIDETAKALGVSAPTVKRRWQWVRTWLYREPIRSGN